MIVQTVGDLIAGKPFSTITPACPVDSACVALAQERTCSIAVCEGGRLIGVLSERDIMQNWDLIAREGRNLRVAQIMTPKPATIDADASLADARRKMDAEGVRSLAVVRHGRAIAMLSRDDIPTERRIMHDRFRDATQQIAAE